LESGSQPGGNREIAPRKYQLVAALVVIFADSMEALKIISKADGKKHGLIDFIMIIFLHSNVASMSKSFASNLKLVL